MKKILIVFFFFIASAAHSEDYNVHANKVYKVSSFTRFFVFYLGRLYFSSRDKLGDFEISTEILDGKVYIGDENSKVYLPSNMSEDYIYALIDKYRKSGKNLYSDSKSCVTVVDHYRVKTSYDHLSQKEIEEYAKTFDRGIRDIVGFVIYQTVPKIKSITIYVPENSVLYYNDNNTSHIIVDNKSNNVYQYALNFKNLPDGFSLYSTGGKFSLEMGSKGGFSSTYCP